MGSTEMCNDELYSNGKNKSKCNNLYLIRRDLAKTIFNHSRLNVLTL